MEKLFSRLCQNITAGTYFPNRRGKVTRNQWWVLWNDGQLLLFIKFSVATTNKQIQMSSTSVADRGRWPDASNLIDSYTRKHSVVSSTIYRKKKYRKREGKEREIGKRKYFLMKSEKNKNQIWTEKNVVE